jgi:hypothetical protein
MPTIGLLDAHRLAWAHRASRMEGLQDLELGFLVGTNDPRPAGRMQVQPYDPTDFGPKVGIWTVQPSAHAMGFEIGVAQPSVDGALADSPDEVPLHWPERVAESPSACECPTTPRGGYTPWTGHHDVLRGEKRAGRPERGVSISPFNRSRAKRSRHCRTRPPVHGAGDGPIAQPAPREQDGPSSECHPSPGAASPTQVLQDPPLAGRQSDRCFGFGPSPARLPMPFLFSHATQDMSPRVGPEFMGQCTSSLLLVAVARGH